MIRNLKLLLSIGIFLTALSSNFASEPLKAEVKRVENPRFIDDYFTLEVEFTNSSKETLLVFVPEDGEALGLEVKIAAPGWVKKEPSGGKNVGITVVIPKRQSTLLELAPGAKARYSLDVRDFFSELDLSTGEIDVGLQIQGFEKEENPGGEAKSVTANWSGKISLPIKNKKGVIIRM